MNKLRGARGEVQTTAADSGEVRAQVAGASRGCARLGRRSAGETISTGLISYLCAGGLLALGALGAAGCGKENNVTQSSQVDVGKQCSGPEDKGCGPGGVCVLGVCRHGCETDASCERGALCLGDRLPFGCSLPSELACSSTQPCEAHLSCGADGKCRMPCSSASDCPRNEHLCIAGTCVSRSDSEIDAWQSCETGQRSCDGQTVLACNEVSSGWGEVGRCDGETEFCESGSCISCREVMSCSGNQVMRSCEQGGEAELAENCTGDKPFCAGGNCIACEMNAASLRCDGADLKGSCLQGGEERVVEDCAASGRGCYNGACREKTCEPGASRCSGQQPERCDAQGVAFEAEGAACSGSTSCSEGTCEAWVCEPGEVFGCNENAVMHCASSGISRVETTCTGGTPYCEAGECVDNAVNGYARWPIPGTPGHGFSYTVNEAEGTVLDNITGLLWQRDVAPGTNTWQEAQAYCEGLELGGRSDWRLPTRMELISIVDYTTDSPAIDNSAFPGTPNSHLWTGSLRNGASQSWYVHFGDGYSDAAAINEAYSVRCVAESEAQKPIPPSGHFFEVTPNGLTVLDTATGLEWERGSSPSQQTQADQIIYCNNLNLDGKMGWRLPTVAELSSLVPGRKVALSHIDTSIFPGTNSEYWTASAYSSSVYNRWRVSFYRGYTYRQDRGYMYFARCVR